MKQIFETATRMVRNGSQADPDLSPRSGSSAFDLTHSFSAPDAMPEGNVERDPALRLKLAETRMTNPALDPACQTMLGQNAMRLGYLT